jgi:hypothetical protein
VPDYTKRDFTALATAISRAGEHKIMIPQESRVPPAYQNRSISEPSPSPTSKTGLYIPGRRNPPRARLNKRRDFISNATHPPLGRPQNHDYTGPASSLIPPITPTNHLKHASKTHAALARHTNRSLSKPTKETNPRMMKSPSKIGDKKGPKPPSIFEKSFETRLSREERRPKRGQKWTQKTDPKIPSVDPPQIQPGTRKTQ